jgi:hypothetical protein
LDDTIKDEDFPVGSRLKEEDVLEEGTFVEEDLFDLEGKALAWDFL